MSNKTFTSEKIAYKITVYPAPSGGKRFPMILLVHGNFGLGPPFGDQIHGFAKELAGRGYLTAVPQYYQDDEPHPFDREPHVQTLTDAIAAVAARPDADRNRLGLIGFSLGAATAMTYIASHPPGTVKALADFFGFLTPTIRAGVGKFPPTIILHNQNDRVVSVHDSEELNRLFPSWFFMDAVKYRCRFFIISRAHRQCELFGTAVRRLPYRKAANDAYL